jgi:hypothetical protein
MRIYAVAASARGRAAGLAPPWLHSPHGRPAGGRSGLFRQPPKWGGRQGRAPLWLKPERGHNMPGNLSAQTRRIGSMNSRLRIVGPLGSSILALRAVAASAKPPNGAALQAGRARVAELPRAVHAAMAGAASTAADAAGKAP